MDFCGSGMQQAAPSSGRCRRSSDGRTCAMRSSARCGRHRRVAASYARRSRRSRTNVAATGHREAGPLCVLDPGPLAVPGLSGQGWRCRQGAPAPSARGRRDPARGVGGAGHRAVQTAPFPTSRSTGSSARMLGRIPGIDGTGMTSGDCQPACDWRAEASRADLDAPLTAECPALTLHVRSSMLRFRRE